MTLPPPLLVTTGDRKPDARIAVVGSVEDPLERRRALAFGHVLSKARAVRGLDRPLDLQPTQNGDRPTAQEGKVWVPHMACFDGLADRGLVWERCDEGDVEEKLGAPLGDIERWASRPEVLLRLLSLAAAGGRFVEAESGQAYLSFRWVLDHQEQAAAAATEGLVAIDHVSIHVDPDEEAAVADLLIGVLGLAEIPRPLAITVPGRWLDAGSGRVHLNHRSAHPGESGFPGPKPNHICFSVADLDAAEQALEAAGVPTERAGSIGDQLWFRLAGTAIELQRLRG